MKFKRVLTALLAVCMVASMAACSEKKVEENQEMTPGVETPVTETAAPTDETENEGQEVPENTKEPSAKPQEKPQEKPQAAPEVKPENTPEAKPTEVPQPKPETVPEVKPTVTPSPKPQETPKPQEQPKTDGQKLLADFKAKAASGGSALAIAEAVAANPLIPFSAAATPVSPGYLSGFGNTEITGFKEGAMFGPIIGAVPFVGYVFELADGTDASAFISLLKSSADLRWNICVAAEEMVAGSSGNKVFFVMSNKDLNAEE